MIGDFRVHWDTSRMTNTSANSKPGRITGPAIERIRNALTPLLSAILLTRRQPAATAQGKT